MFFRMVYDEKLAQAAYLIGCPKSGEAVVIDPERDVDRYEALAKKEGLRIVGAAETHIHADFVSGARELAERGARVYVSGEGGEWRSRWLDQKSGGGRYDAKELKDGDAFRVGEVELTAAHTPGHTPEHLSYFVTDRGGGGPMGIATGDFVFVGDVGRPDLLESAAGQAGAKEPAAQALYASVGRFKRMAEHLQVWPGHGAGSACGKALGAVPQSTVGYERRYNPAIAAAGSEREFVEYVLAGQPEPPAYFARMKRVNRDGPPVLGELPRARRMTAAELAAVDPRRAAVVDTRAWKEFAAGHLPGSLYLPLNQSFTTDAGSLIAEGEAVYLVLEGARVEEAVRDLVRIGLDDVRGFVEPGDLREYAGAGGRMERSAEVDVAGARRRIESGAAVLDVRRAAEFAEGHIGGAMNISHTRLAPNLEQVSRRELIVHCKAGGRSARAVAYLQRMGFDAVNLAGGFTAWEQGGAPVEHAK